MRVTLLSLVMVMGFLTGCSSFNWLTESVANGDESATSYAEDYDSLMQALETLGTTIETAEAISQPFFDVDGQILQINGVDVQVFEFEDPDAASAAAATISPDGGSVGTNMMMWMEPPHFYKAGRLIVLYVGTDDAVLSALTATLGEQIAGR